MRGEEEGRQEDGEDSPPAGRSHRVGMIMRALFSVIQLAVEGGKGGKAVGTQIQFASRTREPASRLVPLLARTPSFEAQSMFLTFLYHVRSPMRRALNSKDSDRGAASKRAHKGVPCAQPYAPGTEF